MKLRKSLQTALGQIFSTRPTSFSQRYASTISPPVLSSTVASTSQTALDDKRIGTLAVKKGMTALWDKNGTRIPCTILKMEQVQVTGHRLKPYTAVQIGCLDRPAKSTNNALVGHFRKAGVNPKAKTMEFCVDRNGLVPIGSTMKPSHFVPGQYLDVQAKSVGKGFAGVMKRHGFKGLSATHGVSISHRSHGSTGQHQDPGRVFPGKKMAGRLGGKLRTNQNLLLVRVDNQEDLLYVKGSVPGSEGAMVRVRDSVRKIIAKNDFGVTALPFPAGSADMMRRLGLKGEISLQVMTKGNAV